jgi:hypothetical protein
VELSQIAEKIKVDPAFSIRMTRLYWVICSAKQLWQGKTEMFDVVPVLEWDLNAIRIQLIWSCGTLLR